MTEYEALEQVKKSGTLIEDLPEEFRTKEFLIKVISVTNMPTTIPYTKSLGIKSDYDIALANEVVYMRRGALYWRIKTLNFVYGSHLTKEEINKLTTTLRMLIN